MVEQREVKIEGDRNSPELRQRSAELMVSFRRWKLSDVLVKYYFDKAAPSDRVDLYVTTLDQRSQKLEPYLAEAFGRLGRNAAADIRKALAELLDLAGILEEDFDEVSGSITFNDIHQPSQAIHWADEVSTQTRTIGVDRELTEEYRRFFQQSLRELGASQLRVNYSTIAGGKLDCPDYFFGDECDRAVDVDPLDASFQQIEEYLFEILEKGGILDSWPEMDLTGKISVSLFQDHRNYWWNATRRELRLKTVRSFSTTVNTRVSTGGGFIQPEALVPLWQ